jgi:ribosomal protein S27E
MNIPMQQQVKDCGHRRLAFASGDYYVCCLDCPVIWVMVEPGTADLKSVTVANQGANSQLSGQKRLAPGALDQG